MEIVEAKYPSFASFFTVSFHLSSIDTAGGRQSVTNRSSAVKCDRANDFSMCLTGAHGAETRSPQWTSLPHNPLIHIGPDWFHKGPVHWRPPKQWAWGTAAIPSPAWSFRRDFSSTLRDLTTVSPKLSPNQNVTKPLQPHHSTASTTCHTVSPNLQFAENTSETLRL